MGDKDITESNFEHLAPIFADIVNAFFAMNGIEDRVRPEDLRDARARTSYKTGGELHTQERDVVKHWMAPGGEVELCLLGLENQSIVDTYLVMRVAGYDGADYRGQVPPKRKKGERYRAKKPHFVITIVLYFGTRRRWPRRRSLQDRLNVPEQYRAITMQEPLNVIELAFLTEEQEKLFKTDMRHVVRCHRRERLGEEAVPMLPDAIEHAPELFELLSTLTGDLRFKEAIAEAQRMQERGETITMTSFLERAERRGEERGRSVGIAIGEARGEERGRTEAQRVIWNRLIAGGISPKDAAMYTGLPVPGGVSV